ncbi:MAG: diguanylate cyclase, partial [Gammaproteobacteria bacterium]|nr:diguanylate cyclase [Gammaproteobacteria bacterium]
MNDIKAYVADRDALFHELNNYIDNHQVTGKKLAVLLIKIDYFRRINMIHGHTVGDNLLEEFTTRLQNASRKKDFLARMGNAEFIMILPEIMNEGHSILAANKLLNSIEAPVIIEDKKLKINAHIGISIFPDQAEDINSLITKAETALIAARTTNNYYSVYNDDTNEDELNLWDIQTYLDSALENDEFELYFQPQVNMQTGLVFGAEALIRWNNKEKG